MSRRVGERPDRDQSDLQSLQAALDQPIPAIPEQDRATVRAMIERQAAAEGWPADDVLEMLGLGESA